MTEEREKQAAMSGRIPSMGKKRGWTAKGGAAAKGRRSNKGGSPTHRSKMKGTEKV